jgi:hypothetical protein
VFTIGNRHIEQYTRVRIIPDHLTIGSIYDCSTNQLFSKQGKNRRRRRRRGKENRIGMKKFIHLKRIMIESGEDYGLGFPTSPKTPNTVSKLLNRKEYYFKNIFFVL